MDTNKMQMKYPHDIRQTRNPARAGSLPSAKKNLPVANKGKYKQNTNKIQTKYKQNANRIQTKC